MKRGIVVVLILLLLGAIINIAVAWGFAAFGPVLPPLPLDPTAPLRGHLIERIGASSHFSPNRESATTGILYDWRGWPTKTMKSLTRMGAEAEQAVDWPAFGIVTEPTRKDSMNLHFPRVLPLLPLFPGFAINTALYATMLGAVWLGGKRLVGRTRQSQL